MYRWSPTTVTAQRWRRSSRSASASTSAGAIVHTDTPSQPSAGRIPRVPASQLHLKAQLQVPQPPAVGQMSAERRRQKLQDLVGQHAADPWRQEDEAAAPSAGTPAVAMVGQKHPPAPPDNEQ